MRNNEIAVQFARLMAVRAHACLKQAAEFPGSGYTPVLSEPGTVKKAPPGTDAARNSGWRPSPYSQWRARNRWIGPYRKLQILSRDWLGLTLPREPAPPRSVDPEGVGPMPLPPPGEREMQ